MAVERRLQTLESKVFDVIDDQVRQLQEQVATLELNACNITPPANVSLSIADSVAGKH